MYNIEDRRGAIAAIQRLLGINESGIYDEMTKSAVMRAQINGGVAETGIVDYETFLIIRDNYHKRLRQSEAEARLSVPRFPYKVGDRGSDVGIINADIRVALPRYTHEDMAPRGDYYTSYTAAAVRRLRQIYILPNGSQVDEDLYYRLIRDILT